MIIAICGSLTAHDQILSAQNKLEKLKHQVIIPFGTEKIKKGEWQLDNLQHHKDEFKSFALKAYFDEIKKADAILVINIDKQEVKNHIGGNTLMEMGLARYFNKKIFLLNPIPDMPYTEEIIGVKPIILNGNLEKII